MTTPPAVSAYPSAIALAQQALVSQHAVAAGNPPTTPPEVVARQRTLSAQHNSSPR